MSVFFGKSRVDAQEKFEAVQGLFSRVVNRYDLMNDLMSGGLHRCWKTQFVEALPGKKSDHVLDLATGTGDIARRLEDRGFKITACDPNEDMLVRGRERLINRGYGVGMAWVKAPAEKLPFEPDSFEGVTISFGMRNVANRGQALREIVRVLKPGGWFGCLEFSHPDRGEAFSPLYTFYARRVIPTLGRVVAQDQAAYQYLVDSIETFPKPEDFSKEMEEEGLKVCRFFSLIPGLVWVHLGMKPDEI